MCIFCKIANHEIPAYIIHEDENFMAFLDLSQATLGHTLVIPKKHQVNLFDMDDQTGSSILLFVRDLAKQITEAMGSESANIIHNAGSLAGQSVFHFHIHIIPRYENDHFHIPPLKNELTPDELLSIQKKIKEKH